MRIVHDIELTKIKILNSRHKFQRFATQMNCPLPLSTQPLSFPILHNKERTRVKRSEWDMPEVVQCGIATIIHVTFSSS